MRRRAARLQESAEVSIFLPLSQPSWTNPKRVQVKRFAMPDREGMPTHNFNGEGRHHWTYRASLQKSTLFDVSFKLFKVQRTTGNACQLEDCTYKKHSQTTTPSLRMWTLMIMNVAFYLSTEHIVMWIIECGQCSLRSIYINGERLIP